MNRYASQQYGFTLVELIVTIIIVGVLAVSVLPRFFGANQISSVTAREVTISALRRAQQVAMNGGNGANVNLVTDNGNNRIRITHTGPDSPIDFSIPSDITMTVVSLNYDSLGNTTATTINLSGTSTTCVQVETTGYAHAC